jgi:hypothetical protein
MLHPLVVRTRPNETAAGAPAWAGVGLHIGALVASGWMFVATLSRGAWVVGLVSGLIFGIGLFVTIGYLFPEDRSG